MTTSSPPLPLASNVTRADAAREIMRRRAARGSLLDFTRYTMPTYQSSWHHALLCRAVDRWINGPGQPNLIVCMPPQHGKALAVGTPIPTPSGWEAIGNLKPGSVVFGSDGKPCRVVAISPIWRDRPVWRVIDDTGAEVIADAEHLWQVRLCRKRKSFSLRTTADLASRVSPRNALVRRQGALDLPDVQLPIDPYVLGVWLGDGCTHHATVTQANSDVVFLRDEIARRGFATSDRSTSNTFGILGLNKLLRACGLLGRKFVPPQYLRASISQRADLLRGLIDTDGHVAPDGQVEFCSTDADLAGAVRELVFSLGCKASLIVGRATLNGRDCGEKYRVMFYMAGAALMPRKADRCRNAAVKPDRYIRLEPAESVDTMCIQVDSPDAMFLCGLGMLPTHNSEIVSRRLPAHLLGRDPDARIIACSYGAGFAGDLNRDVQRIMDDAPYSVLYPSTRLGDGRDGVQRNADQFEIVGRAGHYRCAGVGGPIVGRPMDFGIIDDPFKNREEADSPTVRESVWRWYTGAFLSRAHKGTRKLICHTRWHPEDLVGRLLHQAQDDPNADQWDVIVLPAIAEGELHPEDPRKPGEALWPERFPRSLLLQRKAASLTDWAGLYQQRPRNEGSVEWPDELFDGPGFWFDVWPSNLSLRVVSLDPSKGSDSRRGDYQAAILYGRTPDGAEWIEADMARRPITAPRAPDDTAIGEGMVDRVVELYKGFKSECLALETNMFQQLLSIPIQTEAKRQMVEIRIVELDNRVNKNVRIRRLGGPLSQRRMRFRNTPGTRVLVEQLKQFPCGEFDDGPDSLEMARRTAIELWNGRQGGRR